MEGDEPVPDLTCMCSLWRQSQPSPRSQKGFHRQIMLASLPSGRSGWMWFCPFPDRYEILFLRSKASSYPP